CEAVEQIPVRGRVDLARENALGPGHRDRRDLSTQLVTRAVDLDLHLRAGAFEPALLLGLAFGLRRVDDAVGASRSLVDDAPGLITGRGDDLLGLGLRACEIGLTALGGRETVRDRNLPALDRCHDRRPDVLHREPHEEDHRDGLADQREIEIHVAFSWLIVSLLGAAGMNPLSPPPEAARRTDWRT